MVNYQPGSHTEIILEGDLIDNIDEKSLYLLIEMYMDSNILEPIPEEIPYIKYSQSYKIN